MKFNWISMNMAVKYGILQVMVNQIHGCSSLYTTLDFMRLIKGLAFTKRNYSLGFQWG